jgi:hypothetical protein
MINQMMNAKPIKAQLIAKAKATERRLIETLQRKAATERPTVSTAVPRTRSRSRVAECANGPSQD